MKELTILQIENDKNDLIKLKNGLIEKFKMTNRRKKEDRDYYQYEEIYTVKMMIIIIFMKILNVYLVKIKK